jgi:hypothetical protein
MMIMPWLTRNYLRFGIFSLRAGSELPLCIKVHKESIIFTISESLGKKVFPDVIDDPRDFLLREDILVSEKIYPQLKAAGYGDKEIKSMMMKEIMKRPFKFLLVSSLDLLKMSEFSYLPMLIQPHVIANFKKIPQGAILLSLLRAIFRSLAYLLILFTLIGMFICRSFWKKWIFLFVIIAYFNIIYSLIYGYGRYAVSIIPYYVIFSTPVVLKIRNLRFLTIGKR